jgi:hypothetical protein
VNLLLSGVAGAMRLLPVDRGGRRQWRRSVFFLSADQVRRVRTRSGVLLNAGVNIFSVVVASKRELAGSAAVDFEQLLAGVQKSTGTQKTSEVKGCGVFGTIHVMFSLPTKWKCWDERGVYAGGEAAQLKLGSNSEKKKPGIQCPGIQMFRILALNCLAAATVPNLLARNRPAEEGGGGLEGRR